MAKRKRTNNDLQNIHKTKARVTRTHEKPGVNSGAPEGLLDVQIVHSFIKEQKDVVV
jgi:hypothetical protein